MSEKVTFIIVAGHYSIGFTHYGPFDTGEAAKEWAIEAHTVGVLEADEWWVDTLLDPAGMLANHNM
jgi:hypothetical protein